MIKTLCTLASVASSYELFKVDQEFLKHGLHRDLVTNFTLRIDSQEELDKCSFMIKDMVTENSYTYLEEVKGLAGFDFWPGFAIDIEKPASVSKPQQIMWRLPFNQALAPNAYVFDVNLLDPTTLEPVHNVQSPKQPQLPIFVKTSVKFEYHLRYQSP